MENGYSFGDGLYWIAPYDLEPIQVYCDMTTDGGGWTMFSDVVSNKDNFGSKPVYAGTFDFGEVGDTAYSLNIDLLHRAVDEAFDVMMQYGDEEVHHIIQYDYQKFGSSFHVPIGEAGGGHQRLGIKSEDTSYYVTDCGDVYAFYIQSSCYYSNYMKSIPVDFLVKWSQYLDQLFLWGQHSTSTVIYSIRL